MPSELLFTDSFVDTAQMLDKWTYTNGNVIAGVNTGSTKAAGNGNNSYKYLGFQDSMRIGFRAYTAVATRLGGMKNLITGASVELTVISSGQFQIYFTQGNNGGNSTVTSSYTISFPETHFIEMYITATPVLDSGTLFHTDFTYELKIDGIIRFSGSTTIGPGNFSAGVTTVAECKLTTANIVLDWNTWLGDFWVTASETLGGVSVVPYYVNSDGGTIQWTPLSGTNHGNISEPVTNDDTSYNSSTTVNDIDKFILNTVASGGSIKGIQAAWRVRDVASGGSEIKGLYDNGSTVVLTAPTWAPGTSYQFFLDPQRVSVFTSSNWTAAEINGMQLGIKKTV